MKAHMKLVVALAIAMSATAYGATEAKLQYATSIRETAKKAAEAVAKSGKSAKEVASHEKFQKMSQELGISEKNQLQLAQAILDGKGYLFEALYASAAAKELMKQDQANTPAGLDEGISNVLKVAAKSGKGKASTMTAEEVAIASAALKRNAEFTVDMLAWSKSDAETHIKVANRMAELAKSEITSEEAMLQAIMDVVTNGDRTAALKIMEKMKDCV